MMRWLKQANNKLSDAMIAAVRGDRCNSCFEAPDDDEYVSPDEWTLPKTAGMEVTTLLDAASSSIKSPVGREKAG